MQMRSHHSRAFLAGTITVFLLAFSFNAYACLVPLSGTSDASMANGCSTPIEQPARQLCDAFKTLGVESGSQSSLLLVDHHLLADYVPAALPAVSHHFHRMSQRYHPLESNSPPHQSLATTVLRI
ncbi:MAG: hypothetical protein EWM72_02323 [Nitrospira sp.]|nr:MAG: hypothetical protein EWM72_02323 [Nitrospira sp.]